MSGKIKKEFHAFKLLLSSIPSYVTVVFVISVFAMNLLANKSINIPLDWLALDCGIIVSWVAFLTMDTVTGSYGIKHICHSRQSFVLPFVVCGQYDTGHLGRILRRRQRKYIK